MKSKWKMWGLLTIALFVGVGLLALLYFFGDGLGWVTWAQKGETWLLSMLVLFSFLSLPVIITSLNASYSKYKANREQLNPETPTTDIEIKVKTGLEALKEQLHHRYGPFWRRKLRWILVIGDEADVERVAPGLRSDGWQLGNDALLIWGGTTKAALDDAWLTQLKRLRRMRPIDAQVWVVNADDYAPSKDKKAQQDKALWQMHTRNQQLGYAAPLYLLDLRTSALAPSDQEEPAVGTLFPAKATPDTLAACLTSVIQRATEQGMAQVMIDNRHTFLLQLAQDLDQRDLPRLKGWLPQLFTTQGANPLRGLLFTTNVTRPDTLADRVFVAAPVWQAIIDDSRIARGRGVGVPWLRGLNIAVLTAITLFGAGCVLSYIGNARLIAGAKERATSANNFSADMTSRLTHQQAFKQQLTQLQHRMQYGTPWYLRFGLDSNSQLLAALWPYYHSANVQNVQSVVVARLSGSLEQLVQMPPNSPERAQLAKTGYDWLKAYLMLSRPDRVDAPLLGKTLIANAGPAPAGVTEGVWQSVGAELMQFYADNLSRHPDWAIKPDRRLIGDARQVLINQIGMQNAETAIYQDILRRVAQNYGNLTLHQLLDGLDASTLFETNEEVPGIFTREAWEGMVEKEIARAVKNRSEEIDWVLADNGKQLGGDIAPETLKLRLTERYFTDFGAAWLNFLNGISWQPTASISDVIDQLTLMADVRQSPLIALMNAVRYQGQTAQKGRKLSETLVESAQEVFGAKAKKLDVIPQDRDVPTGPLDATFGPLLCIVQNTNSAGGDNLSLQTYLTRVTRVRLKLQQVATSPDPQAMTQVLAKTVFEGKAVDLTDTRDYGSLIAASLGEEWAGFGSSLFVQPLEQAWQGVLEPAAVSFNNAWRESIADLWYRTFNGRYPFKDTDNDASLPELGRFLRPDSGIIERFITSQLGGVLHKQGDTWVADALNSQGLTFNPQFLAALNQLSRVSGILYASGDARMSFELMARPSKDVVKSELQLDGDGLVYFNQMESWKTLTWPGDTYAPGAQLSWGTTDTGQRLLASPKGSWGWVRLLEKATITPLDSARYRVSWRTDDGKDLTYIMRVQSYSGPLELLKLRHFQLPASVFVTAGSPPAPPPAEVYQTDERPQSVSVKTPEKQAKPEAPKTQKRSDPSAAKADSATPSPKATSNDAAESESKTQASAEPAAAQAAQINDGAQAAAETASDSAPSPTSSGIIRIEHDAH